MAVMQIVHNQHQNKTLSLVIFAFFFTYVKSRCFLDFYAYVSTLPFRPWESILNFFNFFVKSSSVVSGSARLQIDSGNSGSGLDWIGYAARSRSRFRATTARRSAKTEIVYTGAGRCWSDKIPIPIPIFNFQKKNRQIAMFLEFYAYPCPAG